MSHSVLGVIAYSDYVAAVGNKTWDGKPCPVWSELTDKIRAAWSSAATAVAVQCAAALTARADGLPEPQASAVRDAANAAEALSHETTDEPEELAVAYAQSL